MTMSYPSLRQALALVLFACLCTAQAAPRAAIQQAAQAEQAPLLDTLRDLVTSNRAARTPRASEDCRVDRRTAAPLGGTVELLKPTDVFQMDDTPPNIGQMVQAEFRGTGTKKILLIAHMDTVYLKGMLKDQPFASTATRPMASASPTTSRAWPSSCTPSRCCRSNPSRSTAP